MRIISIQGSGSSATLESDHADRPEPKSGEVLIAVTAAGVNRADLMQRQGLYPPPPGASEILGMEVSGTIAELGDGVDGFSVGDEVCALLAGGGYAEYVATPAGQVLPKPTGVDLVEAAGLPEVAATVYSNLFMAADLQPDELVLLHGGASGIGTHAIQLTHALGARIAVTAGSKRKLDFCAELGATTTINYNDQDFVDVVGELGGADVILDIMGAKYLDRNVSALADSGRLVIIGMQGGASAELNIGALLKKRGSVAATNLRGRPVDGPIGKSAVIAGVRDHTWPLVEAGRVRPIIDRTYPLDQARQAHQHLEDSAAIGKVLLTL
ncbi:NAD(P)H-quinone oxidoreductase [Williamsia maris]|uniref:NAD(P)H quinone oxidoreductase, PIG3 family n=1 Tax=Williamsia maris TaxID=72806 RepID=A0ABT1HC83_9NOCA|nr:NAD(P)H-quinone oxidoreductase [Williamsia maris]MCP2175779.1 putative NAD(P)H quinone oxidoreductase, PIG3 family [Williamsia maris]